ncbi:hypothetical protein PATA110615_29155 [Paenibacillus taichungensis]
MTTYPRAKLNLVVMLILEIFLFMNFSVSRVGILSYFTMAMMIFIFVYIVILIKRLFFTNSTITLGSDYVISTKNQKYEATQIECIYMNYDRIGIKLHGRRLVPTDLCFYFEQSQETKGLRGLNEWAARHKKQVKQKFFQTLM